ncbi:hypothetical protein Astex_2197 [Asticcacaulis excentricus CB 48]|uniref:Uncharacterized protein n=1 Tax=Asticcacaulis excentricus (strain ATCC 15261 / DSM 4724 / KCTC 12464 / NCIMB 9791 / VKM B-1370 / CB 48) TaxID=573065 RepID=E8RMA4_ASTEC|nr:hypothetical protein Astex_2197 [Asticcacaulis excentricus CB 48]
MGRYEVISGVERYRRKRKARPVFSGGLKSSKMPCFETRSMNFYGYAYAYD